MTEDKWQRSSFCGGGGNNCIEIAAMGADGVVLRESESPADVLTADRAALGALVRSVKSGTLRRRTPPSGR